MTLFTTISAACSACSWTVTSLIGRARRVEGSRRCGHARLARFTRWATTFEGYQAEYIIRYAVEASEV